MLSQKVKESLEEAQSNLRNALAHAARTEKPCVNKQISDVLLAIECLITMEEVSDKLEDMLQKMKEKDGFGEMF